MLKSGVLFLVLQVTGVIAQRGFGSFGFFIVTVIGSLVSSASAVASAAMLAAHGHVSAMSAGFAAIVANIVSSVVDAVLVARIAGEPRLSRRVARGTFVISLLGILGIFITAVAVEHI